MTTEKRYKTLTPNEIMDYFHKCLSSELEKIYGDKPNYNKKEEIWYTATRKWLDYMETGVTVLTVEELNKKVVKLESKLDNMWLSLSNH